MQSAVGPGTGFQAVPCACDHPAGDQPILGLRRRHIPDPPRRWTSRFNHDDREAATRECPINGGSGLGMG